MVGAGREAASGHRCLPHTADVVIEAWGPTRVACLEQAVAGLVGSVADTAGASLTEPVPVRIEEEADDELLVLLLEEVIYAIEVLDAVPVAAELEELPAGGVAGAFRTVPVGRVRPVGAVPKAISRSGLVFEADGRRWSCRVTVDV